VRHDIPVLFFCDVLVVAGGGIRARVAEDLGEGFEIGAALEGYGGEGMAEVVKADPPGDAGGDLGGSERFFEAHDRFIAVVDQGAVGEFFGERQLVFFFPFEELRFEVLVDGDVPDGRSFFGGAPDPDGIIIEVDVSPPYPEHLARRPDAGVPEDPESAVKMGRGIINQPAHLGEGGRRRDIGGFDARDAKVRDGICEEKRRGFVAGPVEDGFEAANFICDRGAFNALFFALGYVPMQVVGCEGIGAEAAQFRNQNGHFVGVHTKGGLPDAVIAAVDGPEGRHAEASGESPGSRLARFFLKIAVEGFGPQASDVASAEGGPDLLFTYRVDDVDTAVFFCEDAHERVPLCGSLFHYRIVTACHCCCCLLG